MAVIAVNARDVIERKKDRLSVDGLSFFYMADMDRLECGIEQIKIVC